MASSWLLKWVMFMGLVIFSPAIADDLTAVPPPTENLLCISECGTCPVICSAPPPPDFKFYSPPLIYIAHPPPPPPPPHAPRPSYSTPSPPYSNNPKVHYAPPPPAMGYRGYAHPYYYFYSSSAPARLVAFFPYVFTALFFFCEALLLQWW